MPQSYTFFYSKESPFSQFYIAKFTVDGVEYLCAEQYMMHQKALLFKDYEIAKEIRQEVKPGKMKALGRRVKNFSPETWDQHKREIVKRGNLAKFSQNPHILAMLLATSDTILVEASPRDTIWGIGLGANSPLAQNAETWRGQNLLGFILTEVREELKTST